MDAAGDNNGVYKGNAMLKNDFNNNYDKRLVISGEGDYVEIPDSDNLDFGTTTDFSVSLRLRTIKNGTLIAKGNKNTLGTTYYLEVLSDGTIHASTGTKAISSTATVNDYNWHHIVWVVDRNSNQTIYVDKTQNSQSTLTDDQNMVNTNNLMLGKAEGTSYNQYVGELDDIQIFSKALTSTEVESLYNKSSIAVGNLVAKYDFNPKVNGSAPRAINEYLKDYLPPQYSMTIELQDNKSNIIANAHRPMITSLTNLIPSGERVIVINKSYQMTNILKARYYIWTK
jgi:hypothetical protein